MATCFLTMMGALPVMAQEQSKEQQCVFRRDSAYGLELPYNALSNLGYAEIHILFDTSALLFRRLADGTTSPELVESYTVSDDAKTMTFNLRPDCGWSDGHAVTADDMIAGIKLAFSPESEGYNPGRALFKNGDAVVNGELDVSAIGIRKIGEFSFEFDITGPPDMIPVILSRVFMPVPTHISEEEQAQWLIEIIPSLSSGPYQPVTVSEEKIILERNPYFCEGNASVVDVVDITHSKNASEAVSLFLAGKTDFVERFDYREFGPLIEKLEPNSYETKVQHDEIVSYAVILKSSPVFDEVELRQALAMVVDYNIVEQVTGFASLKAEANRNISYPYIGYAPEPASWANLPEDERLQRAKAIFEAHGYTDENPLKLTMATKTPNLLDNLAASIASMWSQLPVDVTIRYAATREDGRKFYANEDQEIDILMSMIGSDYPDPSDFLLTATSFYDVDLDDGFKIRGDQSMQINDRDERFAVLAKIDHEIVESATIIPLSKHRGPWLFQNGFQPNGLFNLTGLGVTNDDCEQIE